MRWVRGGLLVLVVGSLMVLAIGVTVGSIGSGGTSCAVAITSNEEFVGRVVSKDGAAVTFAADDGRTLVVTYPGDGARFLHPGSTYSVVAWGEPGDLASSLSTYCGEPAGTGYVDGSPINTGFWAHERLGDHVPWFVGGLAVIGALTAGVVVRERKRHPRLTIDGRPRSEVQ